MRRIKASARKVQEYYVNILHNGALKNTALCILTILGLLRKQHDVVIKGCYVFKCCSLSRVTVSTILGRIADVILVVDELTMNKRDK